MKIELIKILYGILIFPFVLAIIIILLPIIIIEDICEAYKEIFE
jgi:hypothetical protein